MKVTSTIDLSDVLGKILDECPEALDLATEHLLSESNKSCPHEDGTLERSGRASNDGRRGAVSYDTPYAVRQHEDMSLHHDGKGQAKWLEVTMAQEKQAIAQIVATAVRKGLDS